MGSRLGTAFHETFKLDRARLSEVLRVAKAFEGSNLSSTGFTKKDLDAAGTSLGNNMRRAFPRWGVGVGLLDVSGGRYRLTDLGRSAIEYDPTLHRSDTRWLMHYHLSAPKGPGPFFWHQLFAGLLTPGDTFGREEVERAITAAQSGSLGDKLLQSTASVFLGTYTDPAGLGRLHLVRSMGNDRASYTLSLTPEPASFWAFAYALVDYWGQMWKDHLTVGIDDLSRPGGLANLFFLERSKVDEYLSQLQREGWIEVFRVAPPFQLVRRWSNPVERWREALGHLYTNDPE
jgi:hypothetical protein